MAKWTVHLGHDPDMENPCDEDGWKLYSFSSKHGSFKHPKDLGLSLELDENRLPIIRNPGLRQKLKRGLAHWLSYFEHGSCVWFRKDGNIPLGVEFQWDGVRLAGLLIWEEKASHLGAKTIEAREEDADHFLHSYTFWSNGEAWQYLIEDEDDNHIASCGGYTDTDDMLDQIASELVGRNFRVRGDLKDLEKELRRRVAAKEAEQVAPA